MFTANDILEFAVTLERNGERFYRLAQERIEDDEVKRVFRRLAADEVGHQRVFEGLLRSMNPYDPGDDYAEEYFAYLRAYVDQVVFSDEKLDEAIGQVTDAIGAVRFAKQREQEAVLFYTEMRNLVPEPDRGPIDELIAEERRHFTMLAELEKQLAG